ncbi:MAG: hypothetical protein ABI211_08070 [Vicinamibacterales bacterium]
MNLWCEATVPETVIAYLTLRQVRHGPRRAPASSWKHRLAITSGPDARPSRLSRLSRRAAAVWFIGSVSIATAVALALVQPGPTPPTVGHIRVQIAPGIRLSEISAFAISPDGRYLVIAGAGEDGLERLWIRSMDALVPQPLSGTEVALGGLTPPMFWSPDSRFVAYDAGGQLKKIDVRGGAPQKVCDLPLLAVGGAWNRADVIIVGNATGGLMRCAASGGAASVVTQVDSSGGESAHILPSFLPDGKHFLYLSVSRSAPEMTGIYVRALDARPEDATSARGLTTGFGAAYVHDLASGVGRLLFVRDSTLFAQPFDPGRLQPSGEAVRIAEPVGSYLDGAFFSVSTNGVLVFRGPDEDSRMNPGATRCWSGPSRLPARPARSGARSCPRVEARRRDGGHMAKSSTISGRTQRSLRLPSPQIAV